MVRSGVYGYDDRGHPRFDIIGYTAKREEGNIILAEYNRDPWDVDKAKVTLQGLFDLWQEKTEHRGGTAQGGDAILRYLIAVSYTHLGLGFKVISMPV